jgi:hypothetical protein
VVEVVEYLQSGHKAMISNPSPIKKKKKKEKENTYTWIPT